MASNYPPGVTGGEAFLTGEPDETNVSHVRQRIQEAIARLEIAVPIVQGAEDADRERTRSLVRTVIESDLEAALTALDALEDEDLEETKIESEVELEGEYADLAMLEIPLEPEHVENLLGRPYDVPRIAVLGVPKLGLRASDQEAIRRVLYALARAKEGTE